MDPHKVLDVIRNFNRCETPEDFRSVVISNVAKVVDADAYGVYMFRSCQPLKEYFLGRAPSRFLSEYEDRRSTDPVLEYVLRRRLAEDSSHLLGSAWTRHPLRLWMEKWGWEYSLQGPLMLDGDVVGTVNFARGRRFGPFEDIARRNVQVVCEEASAALQRIVRTVNLAKETRLFKACFDQAPTPMVVRDSGDAVRYVNAAALSQTPPGVLGRLNRSISLRGGEGYRLETRISERFVDLQVSEKTRQVANYLAEGRQNKWIAWKLGLSLDTIKYHVKALYSAMGVHSRVEFIRRISDGSLKTPMSESGDEG